MKVLLISGSPKPNGNTVLLLQECSKVMQAHGVEAEIVSFAGMKIECCIACGKCSETGKCSLDDGLNEIIAKIRSAEGLWWVRRFTLAPRAAMSCARCSASGMSRGGLINF